MVTRPESKEQVKPDPILVSLREADVLIAARIAGKVNGEDSKGLIELIRAKYHVAEAELQIMEGRLK